MMIEKPKPYTLFQEDNPKSYMILTIPHAGSYMPKDFLLASPLNYLQLRLSEDAFTDELFWDKDIHLPMIKANYSRAFIDVNREPFELNQKLFSDTLPPFTNFVSVRAAKGYGTIPQIVRPRLKIYRKKLIYADVKQRINDIYYPYHNAIADLIKTTHDKFGQCFVLDCHSMPKSKRKRCADVVISNNHGTSSSKDSVDLFESLFSQEGFKVSVNSPFTGGYTTCHYGCPGLDIQAIQIEILRSCYMNEDTLEKSKNFDEVKNKICKIIKQTAKQFI